MYVVDEGAYGSSAYLSFERREEKRRILSARNLKTFGDLLNVIRTCVLDLLLYARLTPPSKTIRADRLEVFRNVIHLLFFDIGDDDIYFIASSIVHPAQEHKFWELKLRRLGEREKRDIWERSHHHRKDHRQH